jgi:hypothetical protein
MITGARPAHDRRTTAAWPGNRKAGEPTVTSGMIATSIPR